MALRVVSSLRMQATARRWAVAGGHQTLVEGADGGVVIGSRECGHVQDATGLEPAALHAASATDGAGSLAIGARRPRRQSRAGSSARVQARWRARWRWRSADATGRTQQGVEFGEVFTHMADHLGLHVIQLGADGRDHARCSGAPWESQLQPLALGASMVSNCRRRVTGARGAGDSSSGAQQGRGERERGEGRGKGGKRKGEGCAARPRGGFHAHSSARVLGGWLGVAE